MTIKELPNNPQLKGQVQLKEHVAYTVVDGEALYMDLLVPWSSRGDYNFIDAQPRPLIVFVQGSSWQRPRLGDEIPQLVQFAKHGYIVATVQHRNAIEGNQFPAFLKDVKTAIRFLRRHADHYAIDPDRVVLWGTSSGANAAMLSALTIDDPRYETDAYRDESDKVDAVVSCFGPMDVNDTFASSEGLPGADLLQYALFGPDKNQWDAKKDAMSPIKNVKNNKQYPKVLMFHGDADPTVPYHEMEDMVNILDQAGADVTAYRVKGAKHERDFWSSTIYQIVMDFFDSIEHPDPDAI